MKIHRQRSLLIIHGLQKCNLSVSSIQTCRTWFGNVGLRLSSNSFLGLFGKILFGRRIGYKDGGGQIVALAKALQSRTGDGGSPSFRFTIRVWSLIKGWLGLHHIIPSSWSAWDSVKVWWRDVLDTSGTKRKGMSSLIMLTSWSI